MSHLSKSAINIAFIIFIANLTLSAQQGFQWNEVTTQETNHLNLEHLTDQGFLVARGNQGTHISKDRGASWDLYPGVMSNDYISIGNELIVRTWPDLTKLDLAQGTWDTIISPPNGIKKMERTDDDNIGILSGDNYIVIDTDGNILSEAEITFPTSSGFFIITTVIL